MRPLICTLFDQYDYVALSSIVSETKQRSIDANIADLGCRLFQMIRETTKTDESLITLSDKVLTVLVEDIPSWISDPQELSWRLTLSAVYDFFRSLLYVWSGKPQTWGISSPYRLLRQLSEEQINKLIRQLQVKRLLFNCEDKKTDEEIEALYSEILALNTTLRSLEYLFERKNTPSHLSNIEQIKKNIHTALHSTPSLSLVHIDTLVQECSSLYNQKRAQGTLVQTLRQEATAIKSPESLEAQTANKTLAKVSELFPHLIKKLPRPFITKEEAFLALINQETRGNIGLKDTLYKLAKNIPEQSKNKDFLAQAIPVFTTLMDHGSVIDIKAPVFHQELIADFFFYTSMLFMQIEEDPSLTPIEKQEKKHLISTLLITQTEPSTGQFEKTIASFIKEPTTLKSLFTKISEKKTSKQSKLLDKINMDCLNATLQANLNLQKVMTQKLSSPDKFILLTLENLVKETISSLDKPQTEESIQAIIHLLQGLSYEESIKMQKTIPLCHLEVLTQSKKLLPNTSIPLNRRLFTLLLLQLSYPDLSHLEEIETVAKTATREKFFIDPSLFEKITNTLPLPKGQDLSSILSLFALISKTPDQSTKESMLDSFSSYGEKAWAIFTKPNTTPKKDRAPRLQPPPEG